LLTKENRQNNSMKNAAARIQNKILKEIRWIESYFLEAYSGMPYLIREKTRILFWSIITASILFLATIMLNIQSPSPRYVFIRLNTILLVFFLTALVILKSGGYRLSVGILFGAIFTIWGIGYYYRFEDYLNTGVNPLNYHFMTLIVFSIFFGSRIWLAFTLLAIITLNLSLFYYFFTHHTLPIFNAVFRDSLINILTSLIISGVLLFLFSRITEKSLQKASRELFKKKRLNANLGKKVESKTQRLKENLDELQAMNENLKEANRKLILAQRTILQDISMASNVQKSFFLPRPPKVKDWQIDFEFMPLSSVSGDFYDFYSEEDKLNGLSLFDVSGHGVSSALITMAAKTIAFRNFRKYESHHPGYILQKINMELTQEMGKSGHHLTGLLLKTSGKQVEYASAGHIDIVVGNKMGDVFPAQSQYGRLNGTFLGIPGVVSNYNSIHFDMEKNEILVAYSDGLIEANRRFSIQMGNAVMIKFLKSINYLEMSASMIKNALLDHFFKIVRQEHIRDDITIIILKKV